MKYYILSFLAITFTLSACKPEAPVSEETKQLFQSVEWLAGEWTFNDEIKGKTTVETWEKTGNLELTGSGVTTEGSKTTFSEKLAVKVKNDELFYVATLPEHKKPVWFKVIESDGNSFLVDNQENEYPKQIRYTLAEGNHRIKIELLGGGKRVIMNYFRSK
ncbi:MAG: DUF6265 family protein [Bacteroidota bacterium]